MPDANLTILCVDNPPASTAFYQDLLGREPLEASPTLATFLALDPDGHRLRVFAPGAP